jgi:hypothetical protein
VIRRDISCLPRLRDRCLFLQNLQPIHTIKDTFSLFRSIAKSFVNIAINPRTSENCLDIMQRSRELTNQPQKLHGVDEWSSCRGKGASLEWSASRNRGIGEASLQKNPSNNLEFKTSKKLISKMHRGIKKFKEEIYKKKSTRFRQRLSNDFISYYFVEQIKLCLSLLTTQIA